MNKETIQQKKSALEVEFKKIEENRQKAQTVVDQCTSSLIRLQGAHAQLVELEKEFDIKEEKES